MRKRVRQLERVERERQLKYIRKEQMKMVASTSPYQDDADESRALYIDYMQREHEKEWADMYARRDYVRRKWETYEEEKRKMDIMRNNDQNDKNGDRKRASL